MNDKVLNTPLEASCILSTRVVLKTKTNVLKSPKSNPTICYFTKNRQKQMSEKVLLEISKNSQENTCASALGLQLY